jgi:hypothetical protein
MPPFSNGTRYALSIPTLSTKLVLIKQSGAGYSMNSNTKSSIALGDIKLKQKILKEGKVTTFYDNIDMKACWSGNGFGFYVDNRTKDKSFNLQLNF